MSTAIKAAKHRPLVRVSVACNHWRNGSFQGWSNSVCFDFRDGSSVSIDHAATKIAQSRHVLQVGRCKVPFECMAEWYGNWCWNAYTLSPRHAFQVMRYIVQQRRGDEDMISEGMAVRFWNRLCKPEDRVSF